MHLLARDARRARRGENLREAALWVLAAAAYTGACLWIMLGR